MTAPSSIDPARFLHEQLAQASPDLLRSMLTTFVNTLMSAEVDALCGAPYGTSSPVRPSSTTSGMPPTALATTAVSVAIASRFTMPSGS